VLPLLHSPIEIKGNAKVERIGLGRNELVCNESGRVVPRDTGAREELPSQFVVRAVVLSWLPTAVSFRSTTRAGPSPTPTPVRGQSATIVRRLDQGADRPE